MRILSFFVIMVIIAAGYYFYHAGDEELLGEDGSYERAKEKLSKIPTPDTVWMEEMDNKSKSNR